MEWNWAGQGIGYLNTGHVRWLDNHCSNLSFVYSMLNLNNGLSTMCVTINCLYNQNKSFKIVIWQWLKYTLIKLYFSFIYYSKYHFTSTCSVFSFWTAEDKTLHFLFSKCFFLFNRKLQISNLNVLNKNAFLFWW